MKKFKVFLLTVILVLIIPLICGCENNNMDNIEIITTSYPVEYITNQLYGEHALIHSIYPDDTDTKTYKITNKQLTDFSKKDLFIYNGLGSEEDIAIKLLDRNKNLKIIDAAFVLEITYGVEELWLNPSHLLMISQNIRTGLEEYIQNNVIQKEIDANYEELKVKLSELDAELKLVAENSTNKTIVVANKVLKYLEKYGFEVISLDEEDALIDKNINIVKDKLSSGTVNYIFLLEHEKIPDKVQQLIDDEKIETLTFRRLDNITDEERDNKEDYLSIMNQNIELIKQETYE